MTVWSASPSEHARDAKRSIRIVTSWYLPVTERQSGAPTSGVRVGSTGPRTWRDGRYGARYRAKLITTAQRVYGGQRPIITPIFMNYYS